MLVSSFGDEESHGARECFSLQQSAPSCLLPVTSEPDSLRRFTQPFLIRMLSRQLAQPGRSHAHLLKFFATRQTMKAGFSQQVQRTRASPLWILTAIELGFLGERGLSVGGPLRVGVQGSWAWQASALHTSPV